MENIKEVTPEELASIIETRTPLGLFFAKDKFGGYKACNNTKGNVCTEDFNTIEGCSAFLNEDEDKKCWDCGQTMESYVYSQTIHLRDGTEVEVDNTIGEDDLLYAEIEATREYGERFKSISFGEFCPHCLACM